jgi:hypothetical protein
MKLVLTGAVSREKPAQNISTEETKIGNEDT